MHRCIGDPSAVTGPGCWLTFPLQMVRYLVESGTFIKVAEAEIIGDCPIPFEPHVRSKQ
jgi:hypothetical protein